MDGGGGAAVVGDSSNLLADIGAVGTEPSVRYQSSGSRKKTGLRSFSHLSTLWVASNPFCWRPPAVLRLAARDALLSASLLVSDSLVLRLRQAAGLGEEGGPARQLSVF
jgi:hypothetical protein